MALQPAALAATFPAVTSELCPVVVVAIQDVEGACTESGIDLKVGADTFGFSVAEARRLVETLSEAVRFAEGVA